MSLRSSSEGRRPAPPVTPTAGAHPLDRLLGGVEVLENPHPYPEHGGSDRYSAWLQEFPGTTAYGATRERATANLREALVADLTAADADRRARLRASEVHVQFNHRITPEQKAAIARRADQAGQSTRQFVLNQCLHATVYVPSADATASSDGR